MRWTGSVDCHRWKRGSVEILTKKFVCAKTHQFADCFAISSVRVGPVLIWLLCWRASWWQLEMSRWDNMFDVMHRWRVRLWTECLKSFQVSLQLTQSKSIFASCQTLSCPLHNTNLCAFGDVRWWLVCGCNMKSVFLCTIFGITLFSFLIPTLIPYND